MRFSVSFIAVALAFVAPALAAPATRNVVRRTNGEAKAGHYIVKYKEGVDFTASLDSFRSASPVETFDPNFFNGFSAELSDDAVESFLADPNVEYVEEDVIMYTQVTQTNAPWGLQRISQDARLSGTSTTALTYTYNYAASPGAGVDVYVVDTGINTAHTDFGGRASWGYAYTGYAQADGNGHGTHCAGTAVGTRYGVAKSANVIAVKVLSDAGSGSTTGIVAGLNWVATRAASTGRPSVVSMSLGGGLATALDNAVATLTSRGVHVVVAAGNSNTNAANTSPARAPSAITVGASTITDARSSFSNYGAVVDVFAPGTGVTSAWIGSTTATNNISGTSMACPHVAGLVAYYISTQGNGTPAAIQTLIKNNSVKNVLTGIPSGTVNYLASNNF